MAGDRPGGTRGGPRRKATFAERRERRASVEDVAEVLGAAARFLEARPRSVTEVRRRLTTAGYRGVLVEAAIGGLVDLGYLDDAAFARTWVESRDRARPRGELALRKELRLKGVEGALVERVLAERRETVDPGGADVDAGAADRLLARHARALARVTDPRSQRQRAYALLARHGFDPSTASDAARRFATAPDEPDAAEPDEG
jgi:regulatory protein